MRARVQSFVGSDSGDLFADLFTEVGSNAAGSLDDGFIAANLALFAGGFGDVDVGEAVILHRDHAIPLAADEQFHSVVAELSGQDAVGGDGCSAALDMAQDDAAAFEPSALFEFIGEPATDTAKADRVGGSGVDARDHLFAAFDHGTFGDANDGVFAAALHAFFEVASDGVEIEWDFGNEDDVCCACDARVKGDPTGVSSHDLNDHDAVVAGGSGAHFVDRIGRGGNCRGESESNFSANQIVIDGFGDADARDSGLCEVVGDCERSIAADDDHGVDLVGVECVEAEFGHVAGDRFSGAVFTDDGLLGVELVVGAEDGATDVEDAADFGDSERSQAVLNETCEAIFDAKDFEAAGERAHGDRADDGVQTGAVAATSEDSDSTDL